VSYGAIADRYARAIFELGVEGNQLKPLTDQVESFARTYHESDELKTVLDNPLVPEPEREAILRDVANRLGLSPLAVNAVRLLAARRRLRALPDIARRLGTLSDERAGILRATVTSAVPLSEPYYEQLRGVLERATGRKIVIERRQDPTLIAGVITRIGDNTIDGSVRGRLAELERRLLQPS
jgi:F-type H+-transporting ATPase subunit delta